MTSHFTRPAYAASRVLTVRNAAFAIVLLAGCSEQLGDVRINEVSAANRTGCVDAFGDPDDWIELFNASPSIIDLGGYHVFNEETPSELGVILPGVTITPRGYLLLWAHEKSQGLDHLPFKLSNGRDSVELTDPDGNSLDRISWASADPDTSYARIPDAIGDFKRCTKPSCGASNATQCE